jgi:hypothetical protein
LASKKTENPNQSSSQSYRSIIKRTGIGYKYKTSAIFALLWIIGQETPLFLAGVPAYLIVTDYTAWLIPIATIFTAYAVRNTLDEFERIFNLSDVQSSQQRKDISRIFASDAKYEEFRSKVKATVFSRRELFFGLLGMLVAAWILSPWASWQAGPIAGWGYRGTINSITSLRAIIGLTFCLIAGFFVGAGFWIVLGIITSISLIGSQRRPEGATEKSDEGDYFSPRKEKDGKEERIVYFATFHSAIREIGTFMYRFCVKLIVIGFFLVAGLMLGAYIFAHPGELVATDLISPVVVLLVVFVLFVIPQLNIHDILKHSKEDALSDLEGAYAEIQNAFLDSMRNPHYFESQTRWKTKGEIRDDSMIIDRMIVQVSSMGDWSFSWPTVIKLLAAAAVPLLTAIVQIIASGWLKGLVPA